MTPNLATAVEFKREGKEHRIVLESPEQAEVYAAWVTQTFGYPTSTVNVDETEAR